MYSVTLSALLLVCWSSALGSDATVTCEKHANISVQAYTNWPFRMDCDSLKKIWEADPRITQADVYKCEIWNASSYEDEGLFEIPSLDMPTPYTAKLIVNETFCLENKIDVLLQDFPEEECAAFHERAFANDQVRFREGVMKGSLLLRCIPPEGTPVIIPNGANRGDFETRWNLDCDAHRRDGAYRSSGRDVPDPDGYPDQLKLHGIDFYDAGDFTCEVTYKGRTLRVVNTNVCIKQSTEFVTPTLTCTKEETEVWGGAATFNCAGQVVIGMIHPGDLTIQWKKDGQVLCQNEVYNRWESGLVDRKHSCFVKGDNSSVRCEKRVSGDTTIQSSRRKIEMKFNISDIKSKEFGAYTAMLLYKNKVTTMEVHLIEDRTPYFQKLVIGLSSSLGALIFIIFICLLYKYFEIYFQIWYKRSWLWKYDKDDKKYVAYLSYFYDKEMDVSCREATEKIVYAIQNKMDNMSYNYYDEYREVDFSVQVQKITNLVENCHRMVIVLTPQYLDDKWRRFHAELGYHGLLESRMGLVFIMTPGVRKALLEKAKKDKVWDRVLVAVRASRVINWTETMSNDRFQRHIEYAMPKLQREIRRTRVLSCDSEMGCTPSYTRSVSQHTECVTIPSSPDSLVYENKLAMFKAEPNKLYP